MGYSLKLKVSISIISGLGGLGRGDVMCLQGSIKENTSNFLLFIFSLRAQERPATLILTLTSGLCIARARQVYNRDTETGS